MKKQIVLTPPETSTNYRKYLNLKDEYDLVIDPAVDKIYGSTVIADTSWELWDHLDVYYDGTMDAFSKIKKGTARYVEEEDHYGSYYHNCPGTVTRRDFDKWIYGYREIAVHCTDGDMDYSPSSDCYNEAITLDL